MLIEDSQGAQHLLQNPDDALHFELGGNQKRRLEGRSIIDAINEAYQFLAALRYRLVEGDLSGKGAMIDQVLRYPD
jgi:hypothetical protein